MQLFAWMLPAPTPSVLYSCAPDVTDIYIPCCWSNEEGVEFHSQGITAIRGQVIKPRMEMRNETKRPWLTIAQQTRPYVRGVPGYHPIGILLTYSCYTRQMMIIMGASLSEL